MCCFSRVTTSLAPNEPTKRVEVAESFCSCRRILKLILCVILLVASIYFFGIIPTLIGLALLLLFPCIRNCFKRGTVVRDEPTLVIATAPSKAEKQLKMTREQIAAALPTTAGNGSAITPEVKEKVHLTAGSREGVVAVNGIDLLFIEGCPSTCAIYSKFAVDIATIPEAMPDILQLQTAGILMQMRAIDITAAMKLAAFIYSDRMIALINQWIYLDAPFLHKAQVGSHYAFVYEGHIFTLSRGDDHKVCLYVYGGEEPSIDGEESSLKDREEKRSGFYWDANQAAANDKFRVIHGIDFSQSYGQMIAENPERYLADIGFRPYLDAVMKKAWFEINGLIHPSDVNHVVVAWKDRFEFGNPQSPYWTSVSDNTGRRWVLKDTKYSPPVFLRYTLHGISDDPPKLTGNYSSERELRWSHTSYLRKAILSSGFVSQDRSELTNNLSNRLRLWGYAHSVDFQTWFEAEGLQQIEKEGFAVIEDAEAAGLKMNLRVFKDQFGYIMIRPLKIGAIEFAFSPCREAGPEGEVYKNKDRYGRSLCTSDSDANNYIWDYYVADFISFLSLYNTAWNFVETGDLKRVTEKFIEVGNG